MDQQGKVLPLSARRKRNHIEITFEKEKTEDNKLDELGEAIKDEMKELSSEKEHTKEEMKVLSGIQLRLNQLEKIRKFRKDTKNAPVDTAGAEAIPISLQGSGKAFRYHTLVSLMLSSQTKDQQTAKAVNNLHKGLPGGLTVDSVRNCDDEELDKLIRPVGFHLKKVSYLKRTADILAKQFHGDIPNTVEGLQSLPGVGPKMAYLAMNIAWNKIVGIGVDVHVHRISNRLGWVNTSTPEKTRLELESWLPREHWEDVNLVLVGFGQVQCLPVNPRCETCVVNDSCPTGKMNLKQKKKKVKAREKKMKKEKGEEVKEEEEVEEEEKEEEGKKEEDGKGTILAYFKKEKGEENEKEVVKTKRGKK